MNILFDGNYLFHKSFHVFQTYYKTTEELIKALQGEGRQILIRKCIIDACAAINRFEKPERVVFVIDSHSWRYKIHDDYKYALTKVKAEYYPLFIEILFEFRDLLKKRGFIITQVEGAEGDDLLFMWSSYLDKIKEEESVIISADSDLSQLISDRVSLFNNNSKALRMYCDITQVKRWEENLTTDIPVSAVYKYKTMIYKAIRGDTSDNIPSVLKGFGDKSFEDYFDYLQRVYLFGDNPKIQGYIPDEKIDVLAAFLAKTLSFHKCSDKKSAEELQKQIQKKIESNLQLTYLGMAAYDKLKLTRDLIVNMFETVSSNINAYNYNKEYSIEDIYNLKIK
jgi:5'-3' exonuclease